MVRKKKNITKFKDNNNTNSNNYTNSKIDKIMYKNTHYLINSTVSQAMNDLEINYLKKKNKNNIFLQKMILNADLIINFIDELKSIEESNIIAIKFLNDIDNFHNNTCSFKSCYDIFKIILNDTIVTNTLIRALANNKYFYELFHVYAKGILAIIKNPLNYKFKISDETLRNFIKCLINDMKPIKYPLNIHMIINLSILYCGYNCSIFYNNIYNFSKNYTSENINFNADIVNLIKNRNKLLLNYTTLLSDTDLYFIKQLNLTLWNKRYFLFNKINQLNINIHQDIQNNYKYDLYMCELKIIYYIQKYFYYMWLEND